MVVGSFEKGCQVAVIGSGPGGYLAAIRLAQLKKDVILVEEAENLGGICLNEGCIPSKALIHAADFLEETKHCDQMGITVERATLDMPKVVAWKDRIVKRLTDGVKFLTSKNGAEVLRGRARFLTDRTLEVATNQGPQIVRFEQAVIATGSVPFPLPGFPVDGDSVIGSKEALSLSQIPVRLVVIGGGYIGLELSCVYRKLGSEVALVEFFPELLAHHDPEVREVITRRLKDLGISVYLGHRAMGMEKGHPSTVKIQDKDGKVTLLEADKVLVCVGRVPNVAGLGLEDAGVEQDAKGFIKVNRRMETNVPGIYAVGDVVGGPLLAHKAYREAKVAAEVIAGAPSAFDNVAIPAVIYTDPEIAWAGLFEVEAKQQGFKVVREASPSRRRASPHAQRTGRLREDRCRRRDQAHPRHPDRGRRCQRADF